MKRPKSLVLLVLAVGAALSLLGAVIAAPPPDFGGPEGKLPGRKGEALIIPANEALIRLGPRMGTLIRDETKRMLEQVRHTGFVEIAEKEVLRLAKVQHDKKDFFPMMPLAELKRRASFPLLTPKYLPSGAEYAGALRAGIPGEWRSITLFYKLPDGEFYIGQVDLSNGGVIFPAEFVTETVRGKPAHFLQQRVTETGEVIRSLSWVENGVNYLVEGNLSKDVLMRIAESLRPES